MNNNFSNFYVNLLGSDGTRVNIPGTWSSGYFTNDTWTGTVNIPENFPDGETKIAVRAKRISASDSDFYNQELDLDGDGSSALGAESTSVDFLIDNTAPTLSVAGESGGAILTGDTTSYQKISIFVDDGTGTVSGPGKLEVYDWDPDDEGGLLLSDDEDFDTPHTYTVDLKDMPEGPIFIRAYDQAGNYETVYFNLIKNDRTPPSVTIYTPMSRPYTSFSGISDLCPASVNIPSGLVSISAFPQSTPITKIIIRDPNGVETDLDYPEDYSGKSYVIDNLIDGRYEVTVLDKDGRRTFAPFSLGAIELAANEEWGGSATTYDSVTDKLGAEFGFHMQDWHTLEKAELLQTAEPFTSTGTVLQTDMLNANTADIRYRLPDLFSTEGFSRYYAAEPSVNNYTLKLSDTEGNKKERSFELYGDNMYLFAWGYLTDLHGPLFADFNTPGYTHWPTGAIVHTKAEWCAPIQFEAWTGPVSAPIIYAQQLGIIKNSMLTADNPDLSGAVEQTLSMRSVYYSQWNFLNNPPPQNCFATGADIIGCQNGTAQPADCLGGVFCHTDTIMAPTTLKRYSTLTTTVQNTEYSGILNVNCYAQVGVNCVDGYRLNLAPTSCAAEALSVGYYELGSKTSDGLSTLVPAGANVTVKLADWLSLTFSEVTTPGYISASIMTLPPMPGSLPVRTFFMAKYMELSYTGNIRVSVKYDGTGISSEQMAFMEALKVNDITKRDFTRYAVSIASGVVSFETPDLGAFMLGVPAYASPHSYASADLIGGTPEYSLQSGESDVTLSKVEAGTSLERAYSEVLDSYGLIPAGNAYLLGPAGKEFQAAAAVKMLYDKAVVSAKNLRETTLAIYQISEDGSYISRLVNSVANKDKGEITAEVPGLHSIFVIAGSTVTVPEALLPDIWAPVSELAFALPSYDDGGRVMISSASPVFINAYDPGNLERITSGVSILRYLVDVFPDACMENPPLTGPPGACQNPVYSGAFSLSPGTHTLSYWSEDYAGNTESVNNKTLYVDGDAPSVTVSAAGQPVTPGETGYMTEVDSVTMTGIDPALSGPASGVRTMVFDISGTPCSNFSDYPENPGDCYAMEYTGPFSLPAGVHTIYYSAIDNVGNGPDIKSVNITVNPVNSSLETIPPVAAMIINGQELADGATAYMAETDMVTLTATDEGSGVAAVYYTLDAEFSTMTATVYTAPFTLSTGTHTIYYTALDNAGNEAAVKTAYLTVAQVLAGSPQVSGVPAGISSITWTWGAVAGAEGYHVYSGDGASLLASVTGTEYVLESLSVNTGHNICVSAYNAYGETPPACEPYVYTMAAVPDQPYFTQVSSTSFYLQWDASANPYWYTGYQVSLSTDNFALNFSTPVPVSASLRENYAVITDLSPDSTYFARVQAYNGDQILSGFSSVSSTKTFMPQPQPPAAVEAVFSTSAKAVALSWLPASAGTPSAYFGVYRSEDPYPGYFGLLIKGATAPYYNDALSNSATYYYRVTAFNADGLESAPSPVTAAVPADRDSPGPIWPLTTVSADPASGLVTLTWTAPWENWALDHYVIKSLDRAISSEADWDAAVTAAVVPASGPEGTKESLTLVMDSTAAVRFLAIKAVDAFGNESYAIVTYAAADFSAPAVSITSGINPGAVVGRPFTVQASASDNYRILKVNTLMDGVVIGTVNVYSAIYNESIKWDIAAYPDGYHIFSVKVFDLSGNTAQWDLPVTVNYIPPPVPVITSPADNAALATPALHIIGRAEADIYVSIFVDDVFITADQAVYNGGVFYAPWIPLPGDGAFRVSVQAVDQKGSSPRSTPITVIVDSGPPGPAQNLSAGSAGGGVVPLLWSMPEGEKPVSYNIYRSVSEAALTSGQPAEGSLRAASGITVLEYNDHPSSDGIYYYGATSVDAAGNESVLSNISAAVSDRLGPSVSVALSSAPPLGAGSYAVTATVTEQLAYAPYLTFTPYGQTPAQVYLTPDAALVWRGTFTVTPEMASGSGEFAFGATDLSGNTGGPVTSGRELPLDTDGPSAVLTLVSSRPSLKEGDYSVELALSKPAREAPLLSYTALSGTVTVEFAQGTDAAHWSGSISVTEAAGEGPRTFAYSAHDTLGNEGSLLAGTTYFVVDTIPPGAPLSLNGLAGAAGTVNLSWSAPAGEKPSAYCLYRDAQALTCAIAPDPADFTGAFTDTPPEGPHTYAVTALDTAGNTGEASASLNISADSTPPDAPVITSYLSSGGPVELGWAPGGAESPEKYRFYRAAVPFVSVSGLPYRVVLGNTVTDIPDADGVYYYALAALDAAGNESVLSAPAEVSYDGAAPEIIVAGAADGVYYNFAVRPAVEVRDLNLFQETITLDGAPFVSGGSVATEGGHTLYVSAADFGGRSSQKSLSFAIDLTSPSVSISGVQDGGHYEQAVIPVISVSDLNLSSVSASLNGAPFVSGSSVSAGGAYTLSVSAQDKAGNASAREISFTVDPPPAAPKNLAVIIEDEKAAALSWERPAEGPALYKIYRDGIYIGPAQTADLSFRDNSYSSSGPRVYEVSSIDSRGREGARARVEVPPVTLSLSGYGTYQGGSEALNRGFFDLVRFKIANNGTQPVSAGPLSAALPENVSGGAQAAVIQPGAFAEVSAAVYVSTSFPDSVSGKAVLQLSPGVSLTRGLTFNARDPLPPVVEVYPEALVRGNYSNVRLKFNNRGSAPLDVVTARLSGAKQIASKAVAVELKTQAGLLLSRAELAQTAGASIALVNGEQLYFVSVPGGGSFTFDAVRPAVPQEAEQELIIQGMIGGASGLAWSLPYNPVFSPGGFENSKTAATELAIPYKVELYSDKPVYDGGETVRISGKFRDIWDNLLAGFPLSLTVANHGYERQFNVVTDTTTAEFSIQFAPGSSEAGIYHISARHPDFTGEAAHSSFSVVGMEFGWKDYTLTMALNSGYTFEADFLNTGETGIEGLAVSIENISGTGITAGSIQAPAFIPAGTKQKLAVSFNAGTSASETAEFVLKVTDANGFERTLPIHIKTVPSQVIPRITPQVFEKGMIAGETLTQVITVENIGFSTWTNVQVSAPALGWSRIDGLQNSLGDIGPGKNASFTLIFEPSAFLSNGSYVRNPLVTITGGGADPVKMNAGITVTSFRKGSVLFNVASADIPSANPSGRLGGADMRLTSLDIGGMTFNAVTDANGLARFEDLPSGKYAYRAELNGYNPASGILELEPGLVKTQNIYLPTSMVTYKWSVTPTTITDKYDITVDMTFRTDVPAPVIVINPPLITLNMEGGQTAYAQYSVTNKGLVSVFDFKLEPDEYNSAIKVDLPFTTIPEIKAGQTVIVPLKVYLQHASCESESIKHTGKYMCAAGIETVVNAQDVRVMAGNICPSSPGVTPDGSGGWGGPLTFGAASAATVSKIPASIYAVGGCSLGCDQCWDKYLDGQCYPKPNTTPPSPCHADDDACTEDVCENGECRPKFLSSDIVNPVTKAYSSGQCPNRRPRDKHEYQLDGCTKVPDEAAFPLICMAAYWGQFTEACNTHDKNYQTCHAPSGDPYNQEDADLQLRKDMEKVCDAIPQNSVCKSPCNAFAKAYYTGLSATGLGWGTPSYKERQDQACQCCP